MMPNIQYDYIVTQHWALFFVSHERERGKKSICELLQLQYYFFFWSCTVHTRINFSHNFFLCHWLPSSFELFFFTTQLWKDECIFAHIFNGNQCCIEFRNGKEKKKPCHYQHMAHTFYFFFLFIFFCFWHLKNFCSDFFFSFSFSLLSSNSSYVCRHETCCTLYGFILLSVLCPDL